MQYLGELKDILNDITKRLKETMVNVGAKDIKEFHKKAVVEHVSEQSIEEGKPHDILLTDYRAETWGLNGPGK